MDTFGMQDIVLESNISMIEDELQNLIIEENIAPAPYMNIMPSRTFHQAAPSPFNSPLKPMVKVQNVQHILPQFLHNTAHPQHLQNPCVSRNQNATRAMTTFLHDGVHSVVSFQHNWAVVSHTLNSQRNFANHRPMSSVGLQPMTRDYAQQADFHRKVYPETSKISSLAMKKARANRKKILYNSKITVQPFVDYSKIVVNLDEIGLGRSRYRADACTRLLLKFRRLFIYLTAFCKERKLVESIVFNRDIPTNTTKYTLPMNASASGHLAYALESLLIEMRCVQYLSTNIQRAYDDSMSVVPYSDGVNNMCLGINMLTILNASSRLQESGDMDIVKVDTVLSDLIENLRFLGTFYILTAQTLLARQTATLQGRRRMFRGN